MPLDIMRGRGFRRRLLAIRGPKRIAPIHVQDIAQQELLMLLLVMEPDANDGRCLFELRVARAFDEPTDMCVNFVPVVEHFIEWRAGQQTTPPARVFFSDSVVVRVEENFEFFSWRTVLRVVSQQERFEEPARVTEVPFGRRDVVHGLNLRILGRDRKRKRLGLGTYPAILLK